MSKLLILLLIFSFFSSKCFAQSHGKAKGPTKQQAADFDAFIKEKSAPDPDPLAKLINSLQIGVNSKFVNTKAVDFKSWPQKVYIDPDVDFAVISSKPGMTWQECFLNSHLCVNPSPDAPLERLLDTPIVEREEIDPGSGEVIKVKYMKVRYQYEESGKKKTTEGWIETSVLREKELQPLYRKSTPSKVTALKNVQKEEPCEPKSLQPKNQKQVEAVARASIAEADPLKQLENATERLAGIVGQCPLNPPHQKKLEAWKGKNIYDQEALPLLDQRQNAAEGLFKFSKDGKSMVPASFDDVVNIDTLARTIYSEMNGCFKVGLQYPMAAAKVALNREELVDAGNGYPHFYAPPQRVGKPTLSKVLTAPSQFSVWNLSGAKNPRDQTVLRALCPAKEGSRNNWSGIAPNPADVAAWNQALKIATEAILFRPRFKAKANEVTQFYYTSKRTEYDGRKRAHPAPVIVGRKVESFDCMYLWEGK